ncbi:MAG TPA: YtxH domain-containing protein [Candidatus Polarisedimenticolia bacterium]|nr:YtxH domain-containing protein [Candidatus Polarisedimenticolia bacterium]
MNNEALYHSGGNGGSMFFTFLTGALLGVGIGMLFAPKPGRETRRQLAEMARNAQEKAADVSQRVRRRAQEGVGEIRETMNRENMGA